MNEIKKKVQKNICSSSKDLKIKSEHTKVDT
jgi:hypothetical protein